MKILELLDFRKETQKFWKPVVWAIITFLLLLFGSHSVFAQDKVRFVAAGVTCSMCSNAIHKSLKSDKSIKDIDPNLQTQVWQLEYKTGEFDLEKLKKQVQDAGFTVQRVWLNGKEIYENKRRRKK